MANEVTAQISIAISPSGGPVLTLNSTKQIDDSEVQASAGTQSIGTSWEALDLGSLAAVRLLGVVNNDPTNFVQLAYANDDSDIFAKLSPGDPFVGQPTSATIYAKADTAACIVSKLAV